MKQRTYFAHSTSGGREHWQGLSAHLEGTARRAGAFLKSVDLAEWGRAVGLLHDLGKYTDRFQARLEGDHRRFDHSSPGARVATDRYEPPTGKMLAFCIAGHHAGLANGVNGDRTTALADRLDESCPMPDGIWEQEIALPDLPKPHLKLRNRDTAGFCAAFFVRMVFSALVDADYLDTEAFYRQVDGAPVLRGQHPEIAELRRRLDGHLHIMTAKATGAVNDLRREVLAHARKKADEEPGLFTLTVPTGGGKTLTSLAFALDHALRHGLDRVIYVIPYMSIIEQTAAVFRQALADREGGEASFVVEHHSTFDEGRIRGLESRDKLRLAMENWDAPVIVTTAVQFFESLFANRPSRCRKLHNVANAVVVLDEVQTLPLHHLRPCVAALDELARNWRASIVLCTATQPALAKSKDFSEGFENVRELAPSREKLHQRLKRTRLHRVGRADDARLAEELRGSPRVLCIVNTRRHAHELYERLGDVEGAFYLTTLMCARHRSETLDLVRERLKNAAPVRLVATSLVEAGVDLDFPVVWRAEAGLESISQAAGRCNREGRAAKGDVFVFEPSDGEGRTPPPVVRQFADAARVVMRCHSDDPLSLDAIDAYFRELYWSKGEAALDGNGILRQLADRLSDLNFPFEMIARQFRLIDDFNVPIVTPWRGPRGDDDTVGRLLRKLEHAPYPGRIARGLQPYVVQIPPLRRQELVAEGAASVVREQRFGRQFVVLANLDLYRADIGLAPDDPTYREPDGLVS